MKYAMRIYYKVMGGHTHVSIWTGKHGFPNSFGKAGDICMTNEEFEAWQSRQIITEWTPTDKIGAIESTPIEIDVEGGLIQSVKNLPKGLQIVVHDFDVEGQDNGHPNMVTKDGKRVFENIYDSSGQVK